MADGIGLGGLLSLLKSLLSMLPEMGAVSTVAKLNLLRRTTGQIGAQVDLRSEMFHPTLSFYVLPTTG
jgi:hypothetical protein